MTDLLTADGRRRTDNGGEVNKTGEKGRFYRALCADEFREQCLELISEIAEWGGSVIIFDGDEPVVELTRYEEPQLAGYGSLKGKVRLLGDIEGPMPVDWYTDPATQADGDWKVDGPMPASWLVVPDEGELPKYRAPKRVDVSALHRHKFLTVDTAEFTAQLVEIVAAVAESADGKVAVFDDGKGLVQLARYRQAPDDNRRQPVGEAEVS